MLNIGHLIVEKSEQCHDGELSTWRHYRYPLGGFAMQLRELVNKDACFGGTDMGERLNDIQRLLNRREKLTWGSGSSDLTKTDLIRGDLAGLNQTHATVDSAKTQACLLALKLLGAGYSLSAYDDHSEMGIGFHPNIPKIGGQNSYQGENSFWKIVTNGLQTREEIVKKRAEMINEITSSSAQKLQEHIATHGRTEYIQRGATLFHRAKLVLLACPIDRLGAEEEKVKQIVKTLHQIPLGSGDTPSNVLCTQDPEAWSVQSEQSFKDLKPALLALEHAMRHAGHWGN